MLDYKNLGNHKYLHQLIFGDKRQITSWETIYVMYFTDKGLISLTYRVLKRCERKKPPTQQEKMDKRQKESVPKKRLYKWCSNMWNKTLLKVRAMQIKTLRNYFSPIRLANIPKLGESPCGRQNCKMPPCMVFDLCRVIPLHRLYYIAKATGFYEYI